MLDDRVTRSFALSEFTISDTAIRLGIDNMPPARVEATLRNLLIPQMQRIRDLLGYPVVVKSGYRSPLLNKAVNGAASSQHLTGNACDFVCPGFGSPRKVSLLLLGYMPALEVDQLLHEGGWIHVSFATPPRKEVLTAHFTPSGVSYTKGLS
jgi:zinc D-Ala-D-Ala carboxypeptidase